MPVSGAEAPWRPGQGPNKYERPLPVNHYFPVFSFVGQKSTNHLIYIESLSRLAAAAREIQARNAQCSTVLAPPDTAETGLDRRCGDDRQGYRPGTGRGEGVRRHPLAIALRAAARSAFQPQSGHIPLRVPQGRVRSAVSAGAGATTVDCAGFRHHCEVIDCGSRTPQF